MTRQETSTFEVVSFNVDFGRKWSAVVDDMVAVLKHRPTFVGLQEAKRYDFERLVNAAERELKIDTGRYSVLQNLTIPAKAGCAIVHDTTRARILGNSLHLGVSRGNRGMLDRYSLRGFYELDDVMRLNIFDWHNPPPRFGSLIKPMTERVLEAMDHERRTYPCIGTSDFNTMRKRRVSKYNKYGFLTSKHKGIDGLVYEGVTAINSFRWKGTTSHGHFPVGCRFKVKENIRVRNIGR